VLNAAEDELATEHGCEKSPESIKGLRKIQPRCRSFRSAENRDIRICRRLQEGTAGRKDKQCTKEETIYAVVRSRKEDERSSRVQHKSQQYSLLVPIPFHEQTRGDGHEKVADIHRRADEGGLQVSKSASLLQVRDEDGFKVVNECPKEEEHGHNDEGYQELPRMASCPITEHGGTCHSLGLVRRNIRKDCIGNLLF